MLQERLLAPFEWEGKPSPEDSGDDSLFPYFQNKTLNKLSDSVARTPGAIWSRLLKSWNLWIFRCVSDQCGSTWESWMPHASIWLGRSCWRLYVCIYILNLTALQEKQDGTGHQVGTRDYRPPCICRNHLLPESVFLPPQFLLRFFPPAGRGGGMGVAELFYIPCAAFCSCHLCLLMLLYQGLGTHRGKLNDANLRHPGEGSRLSTDDGRPTYGGCLPRWHPWLCSFGVFSGFNLRDKLKPVCVGRWWEWSEKIRLVNEMCPWK